MGQTPLMSLDFYNFIFLLFCWICLGHLCDLWWGGLIIYFLIEKIVEIYSELKVLNDFRIVIPNWILVKSETESEIELEFKFET